MRASAKYIFCLLALISFFHVHHLYSANSYEVQFIGIDDPEIVHLLESVSATVELQETPPATHAGLRRRGEATFLAHQSLTQSLLLQRKSECRG